MTPDWPSAVTKAQQGDLSAYDALVRRFMDMAVGYAYSVLGDFGQAEDAAQEAFVRAYLDLKMLAEPRAFAAWLRRIVHKQCDRATRRKRPATVPLESALDLATPTPGPQEMLEREETRRAVLAAVDALPEHERATTALFYIDGYSVAEVGEFLETPVGTVKRRLHSARSRLREGMVAMVGEAFKQHAPGDAFAERVRKVVGGIREVPWESIWLTYEGSAYACLKSLEPEITLDCMMGLCGGAFRFFWHRDSSPGMCNLLLLGEEPVRRTFAPFGYPYTYIADYERNDPRNTQERYQRLIVESIDAARPVIGIGIVGPAEACVITGYDKGGEVLYGRSYFQIWPGDFEVTESGYFRVENWYGNCYGLIVPGKKNCPPSSRAILRSSLEWALELARGPRVEAVSTPRSDGESWLYSGLAAYDPLAEEFLRERAEYASTEIDRFWPAVELLMFNGIWLLLSTRESAARFLASFAQSDLPEASHLSGAVEAYTREAAVCRSATEWIPLQAGEQVFALADPAVRKDLRRVVLEAKEHEERAVACLEQAHARLLTSA